MVGCQHLSLGLQWCQCCVVVMMHWCWGLANLDWGLATSCANSICCQETIANTRSCGSNCRYAESLMYLSLISPCIIQSPVSISHYTFQDYLGLSSIKCMNPISQSISFLWEYMIFSRMGAPGHMRAQFQIGGTGPHNALI